MCMEPKSCVASGVTVIGAETPSNYHVSQRSEVPGSLAVLAPPSGVVTPVSVGMAESMEKKKRGRPRKYGQEGNVQKVLAVIDGYSSGKRGRGRSSSEAKEQQRLQMMTIGDEFERSDGANFTPHVITVNIGEDVTAKIISFCQQGPRAICVLSANGMISNAILRQSDSSGGTLTYEGRFEIVNLCGSFTPTQTEGTRYREGGLSVSLSSPNGQIVGGCVAGLLIAASPIQIIVGSFLPTVPPEVKPKRPKAQQTPPSLPAPFTITAALPPPTNVDKESRNGQGPNTSIPPMPNLSSPTLFQRENWSNTHSTQERRTSTTDINISLPGGIQ